MSKLATARFVAGIGLIFALVLPAGGVRAKSPERSAAEPPVPAFVPDPATVQREGAGYRYPQAGWIVLHIEGDPYERGYQHGKLMAREIAEYVRCFAESGSHTSPADGWHAIRTTSNALFLRRYDREYLDEMRGIADGAAAGGAKYDDRAIDLVDIVALNAWAELMTLDEALEATPTGLEGKKFMRAAEPQTRPAVERCSSFAATGPATADGKMVIGHITMFDLYPCLFMNVWLDVKPTNGHRIVMQSYPGGIESGTDFYINDAGIAVTETTLNQTQFNPQGMAEASRIRHALQYADSIDGVCHELTQPATNGLYTNEWLIGDAKTNEIAMFELGTARTKLWRSGHNDWFGNTPGFYWGCNNTKDLAVRLETAPGTAGAPADPTFCPADRDMLWQKLYQQHKGHIDAAFAKMAFSTPPLCSSSSCDVKFTTSDMARRMQAWALFGNATGRTWKPRDDEKKDFPNIEPLVSNPWTVLGITAPAAANASDPVPQIVDLKPSANATETESDSDDEKPFKPEDATEPAWHGTVLPAGDGDVWLAAGLADYEHIVAKENSLATKQDDKKLTPEQRDKIAVRLFGPRSQYLSAVRQLGAEPAISKVSFDAAHDQWHRIAAGRGVMLLEELRKFMTDPVFADAMDNFGSKNAGKPVKTAAFFASLKSAAVPDAFVDAWLNKPGLPTLHLLGATVTAPAAQADGKEPIADYTTAGTVLVEGAQPVAGFDVTVETGDGETTQFVANTKNGHVGFSIHTDKAPTRVVVDKYGTCARTNGGVYSLSSFNEDTDHTLIVYGTADDAAANQAAAVELQRAIADAWLNSLLPIKSDSQVTDQDLKSNHLLLIGRPTTNRITQKFVSSIPVKFGSASVNVRGKTYAAADTAVIVAAVNPAFGRFSIVVVAGLSGQATYNAAGMEQPNWHKSVGDCRIITAEKMTDLVLPAPDLVRVLTVPTPTTPSAPVQSAESSRSAASAR
jgi:hypothetical protein